MVPVLKESIRDSSEAVYKKSRFLTGTGFFTIATPAPGRGHSDYNKPTINNAIMLMILINGLIAGPAVSLYGSPTVSPVIAAA